jgi:hypothetical protein
MSLSMEENKYTGHKDSKFENDHVVDQPVKGKRLINVANKIELEKRYHELIALKSDDVKAFNKNKALKAELFDIYNELLGIDSYVRKKQQGRDTAKRTGRFNTTPKKKKRKRGDKKR